MRLTAVAQALQATATRLGIAMGVEVHAIGMAYEVGQFLLHLRKQDPMTVDDGAGVLGELFVAFMKTKVDEATIAEDLAYSFYKDLRDVAQLTDAQIRNFFKVLVDSAEVSDGHSMGLSKPLIDLVINAEDSAYLLTKKVKEDAVGLADVIDSRDMIKGLADPASASESYASALHKPLVDGSSVSDTDRYEFIKTLFDHVTVTDDFDGAASIQDDQEMQFIKAVTHVAEVGDLVRIVWSAIRFFSEQTQAVDTVAVSFAKEALKDGVQTQDFSTQAFEKNVLEITTLVDSLKRDSAKALADVPTTFDALAIKLSRGLLDNAAVTDANTLALSTTEADSAFVSDAGLLKNQGYALDFSYFAEDYVGTIQPI